MNQTINISGEDLTLLPQKAVFWEKKNTVFVSDIHFGKSSSFRSYGIAIPSGSTENDLQTLTSILNLTKAEKLIMLGDFWHSKSGRTDKVHQKILKWRNDHRKVEMILIRGNHDLSSGDPPEEHDILCKKEPYLYPPFVLKHSPEIDERGYTLAGHIHPAVKLIGKAQQNARLPCFHFTNKIGILPAFGSFTGLFEIRPGRSDKVYVIADNKVIKIT